MATITHRHTSEGQHGLWWIKDGVGQASGTWRTGTWDIVENTTALDEDTVDDILDTCEFWNRQFDGRWHTAEWDGETLAHV
jgi:hypothetical protein